MTIEVAYAEQDYARANLFILNRKPSMWVLKCFPALVVAVMAFRLYQTNPDDWRWWAIPAFLALTVALYAFLYILQRWNLRRIIRSQLKSNPASQGVQRYSISEVGISMTGSLHNLDLKLEAIIEAVESKNDFFLFFSKSAAYFLPKTAFSDKQNQAELRTVLRERLGDRARLQPA